MPTTRASSQTTGIDPPVATPSIQVYVPPQYGNPHCVIYNNGGSPVFLGGSSVTAATGLYFPPNAQITFPFAPFPIYAIDGYTLGTATTTLTIAGAAGGTVLAAGSLASMTVGSLVQVGNANRPTTFEVLVIGGFSNPAGTINTTTPLLYDHAVGATVTTIASQSASSLSVNVGVT